jgi:hypothetical protein
VVLSRFFFLKTNARSKLTNVEEVTASVIKNPQWCHLHILCSLFYIYQLFYKDILTFRIETCKNVVTNGQPNCTSVLWFFRRSQYSMEAQTGLVFYWFYRLPLSFPAGQGLRLPLGAIATLNFPLSYKREIHVELVYFTLYFTLVRIKNVSLILINSC